MTLPMPKGRGFTALSDKKRRKPVSVRSPVFSCCGTEELSLVPLSALSLCQQVSNATAWCRLCHDILSWRPPPILFLPEAVGFVIYFLSRHVLFCFQAMIRRAVKGSARSCGCMRPQSSAKSLPAGRAVPRKGALGQLCLAEPSRLSRLVPGPLNGLYSCLIIP